MPPAGPLAPDVVFLAVVPVVDFFVVAVDFDVVAVVPLVFVAVVLDVVSPGTVLSATDEVEVVASSEVDVVAALVFLPPPPPHAAAIMPRRRVPLSAPLGADGSQREPTLKNSCASPLADVL